LETGTALIEYTIIPNRSTAILSFIAGKFDLTFPYEVTVPLLKDVRTQAPQAVCDLVSANASTNLLVNREAPPFDNPDLRRALALALDRKSFIDILAEGQADIGGAMLPPPAGVWGMPADFLATIPGYGPDVAKNRAEAREIMTRLGYGPDKRLAIKVAARNIPTYRDPAVILIDQLKEIWIDGELDPVETANWFPKLARKEYQIGLNNTGSGVDDPDQQFFENYGCGSEHNYTGYCNVELEKLFIEQSSLTDQASAPRLGDRQELAGGRGAPDHLSHPPRNLPAAAAQGADHHGQQPIQWLAHGRRVARPLVCVAVVAL
jgi:peptide/nickel transport system substrate-binding protein